MEADGIRVGLPAVEEADGNQAEDGHQAEEADGILVGNRAEDGLPAEEAVGLPAAEMDGGK